MKIMGRYFIKEWFFTLKYGCKSIFYTNPNKNLRAVGARSLFLTREDGELVLSRERDGGDNLVIAVGTDNVRKYLSKTKKCWW